MTVIYEDIETHLAALVAQSDNYDLGSAHFFPVGFLGRLFHFAQDLSVVEHRRNQHAPLNYAGDFFDRWLDDMVANAEVGVAGADGSVATARLIDIEEMELRGEGPVVATMAETGERLPLVVPGSGTPLVASDLGQLTISVEERYDRQTSPLRTLEYLASLFYRAGRSLRLEISNENRGRFEDPIFNFFKFDLVSIVPDLTEDLEQILDEGLLQVRLAADAS